MLKKGERRLPAYVPDLHKPSEPHSGWVPMHGPQSPRTEGPGPLIPSPGTTQHGLGAVPRDGHYIRGTDTKYFIGVTAIYFVLLWQGIHNIKFTILTFFFFFYRFCSMFIYLFYLWLCWVFVSV